MIWPFDWFNQSFYVGYYSIGLIVNDTCAIRKGDVYGQEKMVNPLWQLALQRQRLFPGARMDKKG